MPTPLTTERVAELKSMPHDRNSYYAVINRTDFEGLIAIAEEAVALRARVAVVEAETLERAAKVCDEHADMFTVKRVVPGGMERNYYGGALMASEHIAKEIRSLIPPVTP